MQLTKEIALFARENGHDLTTSEGRAECFRAFAVASGSKASDRKAPEAQPYVAIVQEGDRIVAVLTGDDSTAVRSMCLMDSLDNPSRRYTVLPESLWTATGSGEEVAAVQRGRKPGQKVATAGA